MRAFDAADRKLRVIGERRADADHDRIHEGAQPVQVDEPFVAVDVVRVAACRGDAAVQRLSDLAHHHEIVDRAGAQRAEQVLPWRLERIAGAKCLWNGTPGCHVDALGRAGCHLCLPLAPKHATLGTHHGHPRYQLDFATSFILNARRGTSTDSHGWNTEANLGVDAGVRASVVYLCMKNGHRHSAPRVFGDAASIGVQRALAEFRAGRPVLVRANSEAILALPVDGATAERIEAFQTLFQPARPHLLITARGARSLGLDATEPVLLALTAADDADSILALAADHSVERGIVASVAGPAAVAAVELAKFVQKLPALLVGAADAAADYPFDVPLISVPATAI